MNKPNAFISYSWDSSDHGAWVRRLGERLRQDGVDVMLDQWDVIPSDQLPQFMEGAITRSKFILIICTPSYKTKADTRTGGVGYEGAIIAANLFSQGNQRKFIPILREGEWLESAPVSLSGKLYVDLRGDPYSEIQYRKLLVSLYDQWESASTIGTIPQNDGQGDTPQAEGSRAPSHVDSPRNHVRSRKTAAAFVSITIGAILLLVLIIAILNSG